MALTAKLEIEGNNNTYNVLECDYEFTQAIDQTGRPSDRPRGGLINIMIVAPDDTDMVFHEWMRDKFTSKEGKITLVVNRNNVDIPRTISFKDAYCVKLFEYFNNNNHIQMYSKLTIAAGTIKFGNNCEFTFIDK